MVAARREKRLLEWGVEGQYSSAGPSKDWARSGETESGAKFDLSTREHQQPVEEKEITAN